MSSKESEHVKKLTGSVTPLRGRFRARAYVDGAHVSVGVHDTEETAWKFIALAHEASDSKGGAHSFLVFGERVLAQRRREGIADADGEALRFKAHLAGAPWSLYPIDTIETRDLVEWLHGEVYKAKHPRTGELLNRRTVQRIMSLASAVFDSAVMQGLRDSNPCKPIVIKRTAQEKAQEGWDWLRPEEQATIMACEDIPPMDRLLMQFAWGTGLRQGEQWNLHWSDVHLNAPKPHVVVRYGSKGRATKTGRVRRVPLFGEGLAAILEARGPWRRNPEDLVWPSVTGLRRGKGPPKLHITESPHVYRKALALPVWLRAAGIKRRIRWHDLRHTFASCCVSGAWPIGPLPLLKVKVWLGHGSVKTTEIYAHLAPDFADLEVGT